MKRGQLRGTGTAFSYGSPLVGSVSGSPDRPDDSRTRLAGALHPLVLGWARPLCRAHSTRFACAGREPAPTPGSLRASAQERGELAAAGAPLGLRGFGRFLRGQLALLDLHR